VIEVEKSELLYAVRHVVVVFKFGGLGVEVEKTRLIGDSIEVAQSFNQDFFVRELRSGVDSVS
jgi:hypothetical protein